MKIFFTGPLQMDLARWRSSTVYSPGLADIVFVRFDHQPPGPLPPSVKLLCTNMSSPPWAARFQHVPVVTTKDIDLDDITPTVEHTWGLIHAAHRRITAAATDPFGHRDDWIVPLSISKSVITIVGGGRIGSYVSTIGSVFGAYTHIFEPTCPDREDKLEIIGMTDILVCCASNLGSNPIIDAEMLDALDGAIFVNTAYGDAVDFKHLLACISEGYITCAALDVLPDLTDAMKLTVNNLIKAGRLIVTPHIAGSTKDARVTTEERVLKKAMEVFKSL